MSCGRKIGPFDCCSVVQGDCIELMDGVSPHYVSAIVADPPYGMNLDASFKNSTDNPLKGITASKGYAQVIGDDRPYDPSLLLHHFRRVEEQFWFGADYYRKRIPEDGSWIVWDKRQGLEDLEYSSAEFELCWSKRQRARTIIRFRWFGICGTETQDVRNRVHPNQKPYQVMGQLIRMVAEDDGIILDPYCGSGSTLVAAKKLGRHFLGFEISEAYCVIARERLARIDAQPNLFAPKAEQLALA